MYTVAVDYNTAISSVLYTNLQMNPIRCIVSLTNIKSNQLFIFFRVFNYNFLFCLYLMLYSCISCYISVFYVIFLYFMLYFCISCFISVFHVLFLYFMFYFCISCYISVFHVIFLYLMLYFCVSCYISVFHVIFLCFYFIRLSGCLAFLSSFYVVRQFYYVVCL